MSRQLVGRKVEEGVISVAPEIRKPGKQVVIGFGSPNIPGGATVDLTVETSVSIRCTRLLVPSRVVRDFEIVQLHIGDRTQLIGRLIHDEAITTVNVDRSTISLMLMLGIFRPSMRATITVRNRNPSTSIFRAVIIGSTVDEG